jgi:hypothetical protein
MARLRGVDDMKTTLTTTAFAAALCIGAYGKSSTMIERLASGLEFQNPAGWQTSHVNQGAILTPPDSVAGSEVYIAGFMSGDHDLKDPKLLPSLIKQYFPSNMQFTQAGSPLPFLAEAGGGFVHMFDYMDGKTPSRLSFYLLNLRGRGIATLIAAGRRDLIIQRQGSLMALAASFSAGNAAQPQTAAPIRNASASTSEAVSLWTRKLSDKKLVQFNGYSSGNSGGYNSERKLYLARDGSYAFRSSSSVSVYVPGANGGSSSQNSDEGQWRVIEHAGNKPVLELNSKKSGQRETIELSSNGSATFLNGRRWYVVGINE